MEKIYELLVEDETDFISAISLVEMPAIEEPFLYFNNEEIKFSKVEAEQRMLIGPVLIPEKHILRLEADGTPYKVYFSRKTVAKLAQNYLKNKLTDSATIEHGDKKIKGVHLVESWIKESKLDKANNYGMASLPEGTWMGMFYIDETPDGQKIWNDYIKSGKVKGFSVEALVTHKLVKASQHYLEKDINDLNEEEAELFLGQIKALIKKDKRFGKGERIEMQAYSDYPQSVRDAARIAREQNEKVGNRCMTLVGKRRAADLEAGKPVSREVIARMVSYLSRAKSVYEQNKSDRESCSYIAYKGWGGETALTWAENKLKQIDKLSLAEVGPRGGIKESPKAPKSGTPNPEPKGEGSAKGEASGKRGAKVTAEQEKTLEGKVKDFNERESNTKNGNATLGALKSVFQRGLGAYNTSHSPNVQSAEQWAYARVNAFLYLLKNGRPQNPKYTTDYDLLPKGHPKSSEKMEAQPSITSTYPGEVASGSVAPALLAIEKPNVNVFGYHTRYFHVCPGAQALFEHLVTMQVDEDTVGMIRSAAQVADNVFRKEEEVIKAGVASQHDYEEVLFLVEDFKDIMEEIDEEVGMMHDTSFMDRHVDVVKQYYDDTKLSS